MSIHDTIQELKRALYRVDIDAYSHRLRFKWIIDSGVQLLDEIKSKELNEALAENEINIIFAGTLALFILYQRMPPMLDKEGKLPARNYPNLDSSIIGLGTQIMAGETPFDFNLFATENPEMVPRINIIYGLLNKNLLPVPVRVPTPPPTPPAFINHARVDLTYEEIQYAAWNGSTLELDTLKADLKIIFAPYLQSNTFKFLFWGPNHTKRAQAVLDAIEKATDIETIREIVEIQQSLMSSCYYEGPSEETCKRLEETTGLTERWTAVDNMVNEPDFESFDESGYYRVLGFAMGRILGPEIADKARQGGPLYQGPQRHRML